jgi:hypothetical protein
MKRTKPTHQKQVSSLFFLIIAAELLEASRRLPAHSSKLLAYETNFHTRAM